MKFQTKFITILLIIYFFGGLVLIIIGQSGYLSTAFPSVFAKDSWIHPFVKTLGVALVGSGVFTTIIKSAEYSKIFDSILQRNLYSNQALELRNDEEKEALWSTLSSMIYHRKFPNISDQIHKIITDYYFPTYHDWYVENYNFTVKITDIDDQYRKHEEELEITIKPENETTKVVYKAGVNICLPPAGIPDMTEFKITELSINGDIVQAPQASIEKTELLNKYKFIIELTNSKEYAIKIKRYKVLNTKTDPYKRYLATQIIKDMSITVIYEDGIDLEFFKSGTVDDFKLTMDQKIGNAIFRTWKYEGLVLPEQGFIIIFK